MWNVPYMLSYKSLIATKTNDFFVDYVKNLDEWQKFIKDIEHSILVAEDNRS